MLCQFEHSPGNVRTHHRQQQSFFALEVAVDEALRTASADANFPRGCGFISMTGKEFSGRQNEGLLSGCPIARFRRVSRRRCCLFGHALHVSLNTFGETQVSKSAHELVAMRGGAISLGAVDPDGFLPNLLAQGTRTI